LSLKNVSLIIKLHFKLEDRWKRLQAGEGSQPPWVRILANRRTAPVELQFVPAVELNDALF
jgi:hypothetical protein